MKLSRTISYAVKALVSLANRPQETPVCCKDLAEEGKMPERFLLQILRTLVTQNILSSVRGVYGGYRLARDPREISMLEIIEAIDGPFSLKLPEDDNGDQAIDSCLDQLSERLRNGFADLKLAHLLAGCDGHPSHDESHRSLGGEESEGGCNAHHREHVHKSVA